MSVALAILICSTAVAAYTDLRTRKVSNQIISVGLVLALIFHSIGTTGPGILVQTGGAIGLSSALGGIAVGFAALLPFYALRAMGAGDVKLMMMVGAFLGPLQTLGVVVLTFAAGGVLAIAMALWQRSFRQLVFNLRFMLTTSAVSAANGTSPKFEPLQHTAGRMPYAVAIAAGTLLQLYLVRNGGWALS